MKTICVPMYHICLLLYSLSTRHRVHLSFFNFVSLLYGKFLLLFFVAYCKFTLVEVICLQFGFEHYYFNVHALEFAFSTWNKNPKRNVVIVRLFYFVRQAFINMMILILSHRSLISLTITRKGKSKLDAE